MAKTKAIIHKSSQTVESCETHPVFDSLGFQPHIDLYFDSDDTAMQAEINSDKWSFVADILLNGYRKEVAKIDFGGSVAPAPYTMSAVVHRELQQEPIFQHFCSALEGVLPGKES